MDEPADKLPDKIAHFQIQTLVGEGALGTVYKAWDTKLNRVVALKVLPAHIEHKELREHFHLEARAIAALEHPNIVRVLDFANADQAEQFIALEYLDGASWGRILADHGPATEQVALCVGYEIAAALEHAHAQNIVHRDLKPENVILEPDRVVLIDFGAMKLTEEHKWIPGTQPDGRRMTVGTIGFMAPEQVAGSQIDHRADLFSLGALLYKATTAQTPYWVETRDLREIRREVERARYRDPRDYQPLLSWGFSNLLANLLATNRSERVASASEAREQIGVLLAAHGITDVKPVLKQYVQSPSIDQRLDLRSVDTLVRELRLVLLRDLYRAIQRHDEDDIRWATSRLRYYAGLFEEAERFFLLEDNEKPLLLRAQKDRRWRWLAVGGGAATLLLVVLSAITPKWAVALHALAAALFRAKP